MNIVVIANSTMLPLASRLRDHQTIFSGVGDVIPWLVDVGSPAWETDTDLVVVCIDGDSSLPPLGPRGFLEEVLDHVDQFAARRVGTQVVITTLLSPRRSVASFADHADIDGRWHARARWDVRLGEMAAARPNVGILDLDGLAQEHGGLDGMFSSAFWYLGRLRLSNRGFDALAGELRLVIDAALARSRKVLVLDLDNTLWGGILGEDGPSGIEIGEEGRGKAFRDFQRHLKALKGSGVLLAILSKNDPGPVEDVLATHPMMVLRPTDFVAISADWTNKADRLRALAADLELGLDSFVFVDDSPVERLLVQHEIPAIGVPDFPQEAEELSAWLVNQVVPQYFVRQGIMAEDRARTRSYQSRAERRSAESSTDLSAFIASLDVRLDFISDDLTLVQRISQLSQKTNQFNLTTERLSPSDVARLIDDPDVRVIGCRYSDRFGEEGLVGVAILDVGACSLRNLLLSCRVLGRGVEYRLLEEAERLAREASVARLEGRFVPTKRNSVAAGFLISAGYAEVLSENGWLGAKELS